MAHEQGNDDFRYFMQERENASTAFINGNIHPLDNISTHIDPAAIFGPIGDVVVGADKVSVVNAKGARSFAPEGPNNLELLHMDAGENIAYWVGIQRAVLRKKARRRRSRWTCA